MLALVVGRGLKLVALGTLISLIVTLPLTWYFASGFVGISGTDPVTCAAAVALMVGVALLALVSPAWRATRVEPIVALRCE